MTDHWKALVEQTTTRNGQAQYAYALFEQLKVGELYEMGLMKEDDLKVQHNVAVAQFYETGTQEPIKFLESLVKTLKSVGAKKRDAPVQSPSGSSSSSSSSAGAGASSSSVVAVAPFPSTVSLTIEYATLHYNLALINFSLRQYSIAAARLDSLFRNAYALPEYLAFRVCFLLLDCYFAIGFQQCDVSVNARLVLEFLETKLLPQLGARPGSKNSQLTFEIPQSALISPQQAQHHLAVFRTYALLLEAQGPAGLEAAKREIQKAAQLSLNTRSGSYVVSSVGFIRSYIEYLQGDFGGSIRTLNSIPQNPDDPFHSSYFYNNMGCVHFLLNKRSSSSFYFAKALELNHLAHAQGKNKGSKGRGLSLKSFSKDRRPEILYNNGLTLLIQEEYCEAYQCFQGASLMFYRDPRLWLRLAECCVAYHHKLLDRGRRNKLRTASSVIQLESTPHRVHLPIISDRDGLARPDIRIKQTVFSGPPFGTMTLDYAARCLRSCLFLCKKLLGQLTPSEVDRLREVEGQTAGRGGGGLSIADIHSLQQAALINMAFIGLATSNPMFTVTCSRELLSPSSPIHPNYKFQAHMYAAEAYCMLGKTTEALRHVPSLSLIDQKGESDPTFQYTLLHNLAVVQMLQGNLVLAQSTIAQAEDVCPMSHLHLLTLLKLYVELRQGNSRTALDLLRSGLRSASPQPTSSSSGGPDLSSSAPLY